MPLFPKAQWRLNFPNISFVEPLYFIRVVGVSDLFHATLYSENPPPEVIAMSHGVYTPECISII